jgi:hypothetical protein
MLKFISAHAQGHPEKKIQLHRQSAAEIFFTRTFDEAGQEQLLSMSASGP